MSFFICHYVILSYKNHQFLSSSLCYSVFKKHLSLSVTLLFCLQKKHLSPFVIMSFCLTKITSFSPRHSVILSSKNICLPLSLCHYVFKKASVSFRHSVILSSKKTSVSLRPHVILSENAPVGDGSGPSCCCCYFFSFCLISIFHKLCYVLPHYLSSIYSFLQGR